MMTRQQLRRMFVELIIISVISIFVIGIGIVISVGKEQRRLQRQYRIMFEEVILADDYEEISNELIDNNESILKVYKAVVRNEGIVGYIADVKVGFVDGTALHSLVGVNVDGSKIIGYRKIDDIDNSVELSYEDVELLIGQVDQKALPVALNVSSSDIEEVYGQYDPPSGLNDGVYYAQSLCKDKKGYIDYVEIEVEDGRIRRVKWDGINIDPTTGSRTNASLTGAYIISGESWATQTYLISHALIELQDTSRLAMKSDGTTEIIDGVTANISLFVELADECVANSRASFDKEAYMECLSQIISDQGVDPESVLNGDGFYVYSFEDLSPFYRGDENSIDLCTVYETTLDGEEVEEPIDKQKDDVIQVVVHDGEDGFEDGMVSDGISNLVSDSVDGIPYSEVRSFIEGIPNDSLESSYFISSINEAYKFFKEYMNWIA